MTLRAFKLAAFVSLAVAATAGIAKAGDCGACKGPGWVECAKHPPPVAFELKHSSWLLLDCCLGSGKRPCPKCKPEDRLAEFQKRREELTAWLADLKEGVDAPLCAEEKSLGPLVASGALRHGESEHFRLHSTFRGFPVAGCEVPEGLFRGFPSKSPQKRPFTPEQYDWIVLKRAEETYLAFKEIFQNQGRFASSATRYVEDPLRVAEGKYDIFLWEAAPHHLACARRYFGSAQELGIYKHGSRFSTAVGNHSFTRDDEALHRYLVHIWSHLFLEAYEFNIGFDIPAWIPEGFAHYMEWKRFGDFRINCFFERADVVQIPQRVKDYVLKMVASGRALPAANFLNLNYNTMDTAAHCQLFSLFHYLIEETPREKFIQFLRDLKRTKDQVKAFKDAYGWSLVGIDEPWENFVREKYK